MTSVSEPALIEAELVDPTPSLLLRLEARAVEWGERLNPILVKETRQALKSKQFTVTFSLVLLAGWLWSIGGIAMVGPQIYYSATGLEMFYGYFIILLFPLAVIVPFSAYRSLAAEREDNTYELLSITTLTPRQVISGKLGSAVLQMIAYFSGIAPCLAFTYLLRGIDIVTIGILMFYVFFGSLGLALIGLFAATITKQRYGQVMVSLVLILGLVFVFFGSAELTEEFLRWGARSINQTWFWVGNGVIATLYFTYFALIFLGSAAMITFDSENRSTSLRVVMLIQQMCAVAWLAVPWIHEQGGAEVAIVLGCLSGVHWYVMGALMTGERAQLSPRVRRSLPQSFLGRVFLTWFNPGPGTGYMFALSNLFAVGIFGVGMAWLSETLRGIPGSWNVPVAAGFLFVGFCYIAFYLGLGRILIVFLRRFFPVSLLGAALVHTVLLVAGNTIPAVIQLSIPALRNYGDYTLLQLPAPIWSLVHIADGNSLPSEFLLMAITVPALALGVFLLNLVSVASEVQYVREAVPKRVEQEEAELHPAPESKPQSPWDDVPVPEAET